jgi:nucleotide-binding universal stress UspA family protein
MKHKILIAIDTSENSLKAAKYAAGILGSESHVTLYHVFFKLPHRDIQESDFLPHHAPISENIITDFKKWVAEQRYAVEEAMDRAKKILIEGGLELQNVKVKIEEGKQGVARDILNELKEGGYDTMIVGRRGLSGVKRFFSGSVTAKIMQHAENCAVWVVE